MNMNDLRGEIRILIAEKAYQRRNVRLASGRMSNFYVDCKQVILTAEGINKVALYILGLIEQENLKISAVGGPAMGAVPLASAVSALSFQPPFTNPLDTFFVRSEAKAHGMENKVDGPTLKKGMSLLLLDDVLTTGGSVLKAADAVREMGCIVERVLVIVDRQEGGRENLEKESLKVSSILTRDELESP